MTYHNRKALWNLFAVLFAIVPLTASAVTIPIVQHLTFGTTDNATVQGAGPRTGTSGKVFFNLEGSSNDSFASFGIADFDFSTIPPGHLPQAASVVDAQLKLTQSNSFFSTAGPISVYYTPNTNVSIQPGTSPLKDQTGSDGSASVDPLLGPLTLLGSGMFTDTANSAVDAVPLSFTGDALAGFLNAFNNSSTLRLVVTADAASTAATYVGIGGGTDPFLSVDYTVVPEPSTGLLGVLSGALVWRLRKRRQSFRQKKLRFESLEDRRVLATLWVDPYVISIGNPLPGVFATIHDAVTAAKNGDTIKVMPGTYQNAADVDVTKSVTIIGAQVRVSGETTMISSTIEGNPNSEIGFELNANNITIKNFIFQNETTGIAVSTDALVSGFNITGNRFVHNVESILISTTLSSAAKASTISRNQFIASSGTPTPEDAIDIISGARNLTISNNQFQGHYSDRTITMNENQYSTADKAANVQIVNNSFAAENQIVIANVTKSKIAGNQFLASGNGNAIEFFEGVTNSQITGNIVTGVGSNLYTGIELEPTGASPNIGNTISNNVLSNLDDGISLDSGVVQNTVTANTISGAGSGIQVFGDNNIVSSNTIARSSTNGIEVEGNNNSLSSNTIQSGSGYGILVFDGNNNTISKNTSQGNTSSGLWLDDASGNVVSNNILNGNSDAGLLATGATGNTISANVANQNGSDGFALEQGSTGNTLTGNTANYNVDAGIFLEQASSTNTLKGNTANNNLQFGFYLDSSGNNHLTSNKASLNIENGFNLETAAGNFFISNVSNGNLGVGFEIAENSNENLFSKNTANNNFEGGFADINSNDNILSTNTANDNAATGIETVEVVGVMITGNTVKNNAGGAAIGIDLSETTNGTISGNIVENNAGDGIFVSNLSTTNTFSGNTVTGNAANSYVAGFDLEDQSTGTGTDGTANTWHKNKAGTVNPLGLLTA